MNPTLAAHLVYFPITSICGEPVRKYLNEYRAHDFLSPEALLEIQSQRLAELLNFAAKHSTYYRERVSADQAIGSHESLSKLNMAWPVLAKEDLVKHKGLIEVRGVGGGVVRKTTSGSTGVPATVLKTRDALARERAATWRAYEWAGLQVAAPQARLWGLPHTSVSRLKAKLIDVLANRRRLSAFNLSESSLSKYLDEIHAFRPHFLYGYVSILTQLCAFAQETARPFPDSVRCTITTSELLDRDARALIQRATGKPVFNEYGCGEVGSIAHECEQGQLHIMSDNLVVEVERDDNLPDGLGHILVTDLFNRAMPLIRYRLGDLGKISTDPCTCGRPYPVLERIVGRAYDMVTGADGLRHHPESVLYVFESLKNGGTDMPPFQVVQRRDGELLIRFVRAGAAVAHKDLENQVAGALKTVFGANLDVGFEWVDCLQRESSGKLRVVKRDVQ